MNPVKQGNPYGCGVAAVASIVEISYKEALEQFTNGENKARTIGFYCRDLVNALKNFGLEYEYKYIKPRLKRKIYANKSIVFLRRSKKYPEGHYLTRWDNQWIDSWINFPKNEIKAGFRKRLPEKPVYVIYNKLVP